MNDVAWMGRTWVSPVQQRIVTVWGMSGRVSGELVWATGRREKRSMAAVVFDRQFVSLFVEE